MIFSRRLSNPGRCERRGRSIGPMKQQRTEEIRGSAVNGGRAVGNGGGLSTAHSEQLWGTAALVARNNAVREHQVRFAVQRERWITSNMYFYKSMKRMFEFIVEPGRRVLNIR